jgi:hypothetical protein
LCFGQVATLGEDLQFVRVVCHVYTIQDLQQKSSDSGRFENWSEAADLGII